jgi:hypothetical protein
MEILKDVVLLVVIILLSMTVVLKLFVRDSYVVNLYFSVLLHLIEKRAAVVLIPFVLSFIGALWNHDSVWLFWGLVTCIPWVYLMAMISLKSRNGFF